MRRALAAAGLLLCALTVRAQPVPDTPPATPPDTPAQAAPPPASEATPAPEPAPPAPSPHRAAPKPAAKAPEAPPAEAQQARDTELTALRAEVGRLQSALDAERAAAAAPPEEPAARESPRSLWGWLALALAVGLAAGFALGWRMLDRHIRRRYGGLRIY